MLKKYPPLNSITILTILYISKIPSYPTYNHKIKPSTTQRGKKITQITHALKNSPRTVSSISHKQPINYQA